ncbi:GntR family transcriptional regulator [Pseudaestuariivita atlantica]|nr:GntR family transcriptional regulator [Pseudaestuariivita atlantica]
MEQGASRVGDAYTRLKAEILSNRLLPGFQATEPEIAERLGMSRTPVREALIRLQAEGLVELVPRRGARILPVSAADMNDIYEILTALEPHAAAELALRRPDAQVLAPLEEATSDMEAALEKPDLDAWAAADDRFHRTLLELHGNDRLTAIASTLFDQAHRARMVTLRMRDMPHRSTAEHREILGALRRGDAEGVRRLFRDHRERAARELLHILERMGLPQF